MQRSPTTRSAFTLVELAIVLAVIGLLVGAVFAGSALLANAKLDTIISDAAKYTNAVNQFNGQYKSLPGDMMDATNFWGKDTTNCNGDSQAAGTPGTCNGDGDGAIDSPAEYYRAWQHLSLAKLVSASYNGISVATPIFGTSLPGSQIVGAGWGFSNNNTSVGNADWYNQSLNNLLVFGAACSYNTYCGTNVLTPSDAASIDRKIDDGIPSTGRVLTLKPLPSPYMPYCATSATDASATYNVTYASKTCGLLISLTGK